MKTEIINNYIIVKIDGSSYLIDTGSHASYSFVSDVIRIDDKEFGIRKLPNEYKFSGFIDELDYSGVMYSIRETVKEKTGRNIDGLIGNDILSETGLTIDFKEGTLAFASVPLKKFISMKKEAVGCYPIPWCLITSDEFSFNGQKTENILIDTECPVNYVPAKCVEGLKSEKIVTNRLSLIGKYMEEFAYPVNISFAGERTETEVCEVEDGVLNTYIFHHAFAGIVSVADVFKDKKVSFDYKNDKLYFE